MPLKTYGKRERGYAQPRHRLQVGTHRYLRRVILPKRITGRFLDRLIGASSGLSAECVHSRLKVIRSANVMIGIIPISISYIYISVIPF